MKKIFLFSFLILFLSSCGTDESATTPSTLVPFENDRFSMNLPSNWDIVKDVDNTLPTPSAGEIELAVVSSSVVSGFSNNILILGTDLNRITTSKEYSMLNNVGARTDYLEYTELSSREITFVDGEISILYEFEARYNLNTPRLKFLQTAHICNYTRAYFITLALPTSVSDISRYVDFIQSFRCK